MIDFRLCDDCGTHFTRETESCPSCGRYAPSSVELLTGPRLPATGGLPTLAVVLAFFVDSPWEPVVVGAGFAPILIALAWLGWRRRRRDPSCFATRIDDVEERLEDVERDLVDTEKRVGAASEDLSYESRPRAQQMLERELAQDRRLRSAQRRLVRQLEQRLEQLQIERFREELHYYERCRDARIDAPELAGELAGRIQAVEGALGDHPSEGWVLALEEARLLLRQVSRGVQRLHAAVRLDPLAYADLTAEVANDVDEEPDGELDEQIDQQLERIDRSFAALEELAADLVGDADASGVRVRVDDDVMAAFDEAEHEVDADGDRISVEGL